MTPLDRWGNFYMVVGSSAGALIGLQFVVMTLIANLPITGSNVQAANAFTTPTVVHLGVVLLLAAVGCAPWDGIGALTAIWGLVGLGGCVYVSVVSRRLRIQSVYEPVFEDRIFHVLLPFAAYAMLVGSASAAYSLPQLIPFLVAATALLLLFIGIHNAWDLITYHVFVKNPGHRQRERGPDQQPAEAVEFERDTGSESLG